MKERPILMSARDVRSILAGRKTQHRQVVKPQPEAEHGGEPYWFVGGYRAWPYRRTDDVLRQGGNVLPCPYGQPGTLLWVRETWARDDEDGQMIYRADTGHNIDAIAWEQGRREGVPRCRWRPSIHMPRWASRITLVVTGVRVERLQGISEADAIAEGVTPAHDPNPLHWEHYAPHGVAFEHLWNAINGPGSWDANPWVWVLEFKRVGDAA